jgi:uncharacterized membrane protein
MSRKLLFWIIGILSIIGLALAVESTAAHYAAQEYSFCNINETFDCSAVNRGPYSEFLGIPVALMGLVAYVFFLVTIVAYANKRNETLLTLMGTAAIIGLAFSAYLTYLEAFVIFAWCIICIGSAVTMTLLFTAIMYLRYIESKPLTYSPEEIHQ